MSLGTKFFLSALLLAVGAYAGFTGFRIWQKANTEAYDPKRSLNMTPARPLADFQFTERSGKNVRFTDLAGKIVVVNFFFATCPGSCRQFTSTIAGLQEDFKNDADVRFVSVTVDPAKDTPESLTKYAADYGADADRWWFVTAPLAETQELGRSLKVTVLGMNHTDEMILIDRNGVIRGTYDHKDPQKLAKFKIDLRELLKVQPGMNRDAE